MKIPVRLKRRRFILTVMVIAVMLAAAIYAGILITRPPSNRTGNLGAQISGSKPVGISYGDTLVGDSPSVLTQTLNDAVAIGATTIRLDLDWNDIQPNSSKTYYWTNFDRVVHAARSKNLMLLPMLAYTPAWARPSGCTTFTCAPADPNAFAAFAAVAATRYAPMGMHIWEIWNEPNDANFWRPAANVTQYVRLLGAASKAIKAIDPHAVIVSGGLAPTATSGGNIAQLDFFNQFANQGGISLVDAIGYHPYSYPVLPGYNAAWNAWQQIANTSPSFESILAAHGATNKQIWLTEYGAPTNGPGAQATLLNYNFSQHPDHVDEALQAKMASDAISLAQASNYIGALYWYSYKDLGINKSNRENFFGLRRFDGSAKPAWQGFVQAINASKTRHLKFRHFNTALPATKLVAVHRNKVFQR